MAGSKEQPKKRDLVTKKIEEKEPELTKKKNAPPLMPQTKTKK